MHFVHRTGLDLDVRSPAVENVTAALPILRQKVEMVSGNAKRCRKRWRPYSHQSSTQFLESKFLLTGRCFLQPRSLRNGLHHPRLYRVEVPADAKCIEDV